MALTFVTVSVALIAATLPVVYAQSGCYFPNGTDANRLTPQNPQYLPCNPDQPVSMCCHIGDRCRSDGLCLSASANHDVWRGFCTDKSWQSPSCVKLCVKGQTGEQFNYIDRADASLPVTPCGDGSYSCGNSTVASNNCYNGNGLFIDPSTGDAVSTDPSPTPSNTVSPGIPSVTVTSAPTQKKSDHAGVIAGSVVAVVVVLAAGGVGAWIVLRKRRARNAGSQGLGLWKTGKPYSEMPDSELTSIDGRRVVTETRVQGNIELDSGQRHEMPDEQAPAVRHELGT